MRQFIIDLGTSLMKPWNILQTMLKVLRRSTSLTRSIYTAVVLWESYTSSFPENPKCSSETLGLIHLDLLELSTLSYSKYKWVITFLDDYSSYCRVTFLYKKSDATEAIKAVFWLWSNTTFHSVKCLHTDNGREYMISELQSFLREQEIVYETSTPHVH